MNHGRSVNPHRVWKWEYADRTERLAATDFVLGDVGRICKQEDSGVLYTLVTHSPVAWAPPGARNEFVDITTASLAVNATDTGTAAVGQGALLRFLEVDRACRVRFYSTAAARTADSARAVGAIPVDEPVDGLLYEYVAAASGTFMIRGMVPLLNGDSGRTGTIYYAIENRSAGTSTVAITLEF